MDLQYLSRHTRSTPNQGTALFLAWHNFTDQSASKCNCWKKGEKNTFILIFVPKVSIFMLHKTKHLKFGYFLLYVDQDTSKHVCRSINTH